jgi:hypothetical protein
VVVVVAAAAVLVAMVIGTVLSALYERIRHI